MSHLRQSRATLTRDKGSRMCRASKSQVWQGISHVAQSRDSFSEYSAALFYATLTRVKNARQNRRCDIGLTLPIADRFSRFYHRRIQQQISDKVIIKYPITPAFSKNSENRSAFGKVRGNSGGTFFSDTVYTSADEDDRCLFVAVNRRVLWRIRTTVMKQCSWRRPVSLRDCITVSSNVDCCAFNAAMKIIAYLQWNWRHVLSLSPSHAQSTQRPMENAPKFETSTRSFSKRWDVRLWANHIYQCKKRVTLWVAGVLCLLVHQ